MLRFRCASRIVLIMACLSRFLHCRNDRRPSVHTQRTSSGRVSWHQRSSADAGNSIGALARMATAEPPPSLTRPGMSLDLNGQWRVQPATSPDIGPLPQSENWGSLTLPGQAEQWQPGQGPLWADADPRRQSAIWLERSIEIPGARSHHRAFLRCELLEQAATLFIGGKRVGTLEPPGTASKRAAPLSLVSRTWCDCSSPLNPRPTAPGCMAAWG